MSRVSKGSSSNVSRGFLSSVANILYSEAPAIITSASSKLVFLLLYFRYSKGLSRNPLLSEFVLEYFSPVT